MIKNCIFLQCGPAIPHHSHQTSNKYSWGGVGHGVGSLATSLCCYPKVNPHPWAKPCAVMGMCKLSCILWSRSWHMASKFYFSRSCADNLWFRGQVPFHQNRIVSIFASTVENNFGFWDGRGGYK